MADRDDFSFLNTVFRKGCRSFFPVFGIGMVVAILVSTAGNASAQAAPLSSQPVSVHWSGVPLRQAMDRLAASQQFGFWLDRRVDPSLPIDLEATREPLGALVERLAASRQLGAVIHERVVYIGPPAAVAALPKLFEYQRRQAMRLPEVSRKKLTAKNALKFPMLTEPRNLLENMIDAAGFEPENLDTLPHDLWDAVDLPPLPLTDRLTLVLIGFDLSFETDAASRSFILKPLRTVPYQRIDLTAATEPAVGAENDTPVKEVPLSRRRFTLTIRDQEAGPLLKTLGERLGVEVQVDEESLGKKGVDLNKRISVEVKKVNAAGLFRAVTQPIGAAFKIQGDRVTIY